MTAGTRVEPRMQEHTDRAGACRSSEVTAQVVKDAALYAVFPGLVSFLQSVRVWSHSWFRARVGGCECVRGSCILALEFLPRIFNQRDLEYSSNDTFLSSEKLMAAKRSGIVRVVESADITVSLSGWLSYNQPLIQRTKGTGGVTVTTLKFTGDSFHSSGVFLKSQIVFDIQALCCFKYVTLIRCHLDEVQLTHRMKQDQSIYVWFWNLWKWWHAVQPSCCRPCEFPLWGTNERIIASYLKLKLQNAWNFDPLMNNVIINSSSHKNSAVILMSSYRTSRDVGYYDNVTFGHYYVMIFVWNFTHWS